MDCSSLFLVLHTRVAQICIQVYPPVREKHDHWLSVCQKHDHWSWPLFSRVKTHLVCSSVDSSCSSLAPSLSLQHLSSTQLQAFCLHHQHGGENQIYKVNFDITYSRRESVWFCEHRQRGRENTLTFQSGHLQCSPAGRKPWQNSHCDKILILTKFSLQQNFTRTRTLTLVRSGQFWSQRRVLWQTCQSLAAPVYGKFLQDRDICFLLIKSFWSQDHADSFDLNNRCNFFFW